MKTKNGPELTLWLQKGSVESRVETRDRIKKEMKEFPSITLKEIADKLNLSVKTIEKAVSKMVSDGDVVHNGPRKGGVWKVLK